MNDIKFIIENLRKPKAPIKTNAPTTPKQEVLASFPGHSEPEKDVSARRIVEILQHTVKPM